MLIVLQTLQCFHSLKNYLTITKNLSASFSAFVEHIVFLQIQRWTSRTQQLIAERSKATNDSEELKQLQKSKAQNDKTASSLREEINRLKVQKETISKDMLKMKKDAVEYQV